MKQILFIVVAILCLFSCKKENYEVPSMSCGVGHPVDSISEFMTVVDGKWRLVQSFANGTTYGIEDYENEVYLE